MKYVQDVALNKKELKIILETLRGYWGRRIGDLDPKSSLDTAEGKIEYALEILRTRENP